MLAIAFYIYLLPRSINKPKGKIADDYKRREQEMNDLSCKSSPKPDEESKADVDVIASTEIIDSSEKKEVANNVQFHWNNGMIRVCLLQILYIQ